MKHLLKEEEYEKLDTRTYLENILQGKPLKLESDLGKKQK